MKRDRPHVIIIGAGLAGLCCARHLQTSGAEFQVLEASDRIGGRIKTDKFHGFLLDHGFQVLQTAYPEARRVLDYGALNLQPFAPGVMVRWRGRFSRMADPIRVPRHAVETLISPIGTFGDKLRMARLAFRVARGDALDAFNRPESPTMDFLRQQGFSERIIERFFLPFFRGVYLDAEIRASSRVFQFLFRMFSQGDVSLPSGGIGAIPAQLASNISAERIRTNTRVKSIKGSIVKLESGEDLECSAVVLATDGPETARLLGDQSVPPSCGVTCLYFAAETPPTGEKFLILNADPLGPVNSMCVLSNVAPSYALPDQALISVTVLKDKSTREGKRELEKAVKAQLADWFGPEASSWRHLRTYRIEHALPLQLPPTPNPAAVNARYGKGIYICGEYGHVPGIQWAMMSGRHAAESLLRDQPVAP